MTVRKLLALALVFVITLSMAACGRNEADTTTLPADETTEAVSDETTAAADETEAITEPADEQTNATTNMAEEETTEAGEFDLATAEGVVSLYKDAAAKTNKAGISANKVMSLAYLDGGEGAIGTIINMFEPIARKALAKNSTPISKIEGSFENLTASDVKSAKAVDDGKTTTVTIVLKEQTDGIKGNPNGPVAHGVGVLDGIDTAIGELDGVNVDYSEGTVKLKYTNATIKVVIDNTTGKIKSGKWNFDVNVSLDNIGVKISIVKVTLKGAQGIVKYEITM